MFYSKSTGGFYTEEIHGENIPQDAVNITAQEHASLLQGQSEGKIIASDVKGRPVLVDRPAPTKEQVIKQYESALDAHLNAVAQSHRYDDRKTFALRAGYPGPYQAEGIAFAVWMDTCNVQAYGMLQSVLDGGKPMPTINEMIAALPEFILP